MRGHSPSPRPLSSLRVTDSAGIPWSGRHFKHADSSGDDGSAPPELIAAIGRFRSGELGETDVVDALRGARLLIPLVARLGTDGLNEHGGEKRQELSIVTVAGPDGRTVMPVFSSVAAMARWNPSARPVPATGPRVALAAAAEGTDLVIVDPTSETEFVIRRPALEAMARQRAWVPSHVDPEVLRVFQDAAAAERTPVAVRLSPGDPAARLAGPELVVTLVLAPGLDSAALESLITRQRERWATSAVIASRVDSIRIALDTA